MARPNKGLGHIDNLRGEEDDKWRLRVILSTLTGELFMDEAYDELGVGPTQFANLRKQVLQGALDALQARPVGRPRRATSVSEDEVQAMRRRIAELERDAKIQRSRLELAILPLLGGRPRSKRGGGTKPADSGPRPTSAE
jgi:hypothetical protein